MNRHTYEVISDVNGKQRLALTDREVEQIRRLHHNFVKITRVDNLDHAAIARELEHGK